MKLGAGRPAVSKEEPMEVGNSLPVQTGLRKEAPPPEPAVADAAHWEGLEQTDEFRQLVRSRLRFVLPATVFFLVYYFLLPIGNGLAPELMKTKVIGEVNIAYLFALSQFVMAWTLAYLYIRKANSVFDPLAAKLRARAAAGKDGGAR
jgi:uncharacterized membrane protein (DUF485 family)